MNKKPANLHTGRGSFFMRLYADRVSSLDQVSTLPKEFRSKLVEQGVALGLPANQKRFVSSDGTVRYLVEIADHETVETVWMPEGDGGEAATEVKPRRKLKRTNRVAGGGQRFAYPVRSGAR